MELRIRSGKRLFYGGFLGVLLSMFFAEYMSSSLHGIYHDSHIFRSLTGISPNKITEMFLKLSWAIFCFGGWWMLWKLDYFLSLKPTVTQKVSNRKYQKTSKSREKESTSQKKAEKTRTSAETDSHASDKEAADHKKPKKAPEPNIIDLRYGAILKVSDVNDVDAIKSSYRKMIAQYHPDKVRVMGPEIREIAEKKAKEINEAYEHFRKKFKNL